MIYCLLIVLTGLFFFSRLYAMSGRPCPLPRGEVCWQESCFVVEIASSPEARKTGLMFREELAAGSGMLFVFEEEGRHGFWMKNTLIPLDILWINKDREVVFIARDVAPCRDRACTVISPEVEAMYVLELNAGTVEKIGAGKGDKLVFNIPSWKERGGR